MATYYARANGNVNATNVWSTTASGSTSDLFPSFTNADTLMANGFTVTLNVNTTVLEIRNDTTGGATAGGSFALNNGITLMGNIVSGGSAAIVTMAASVSATVIGSISGGPNANSHGINMTTTGTLTVVGNVNGGSGSNAQGITNSNNGIINVTGNISGGAANSAAGLYANGAASVTVTGNVVGGLGYYGVYIQSNTTTTIIGTVTGGTGVAGAYNAGVGTMTVTRAKGNGYGNGSSGLSSAVGVIGVQTGLTRVYEIEYGDLGQSPTSGPVFLFPASTNVALFYRSGTTKKTLVDASSSSGLLPNQSDVRVGTSYNAGTNVGTMAVPGAASVASGVAVDNTTGTAILTTGNIADIWNYPVSGISVSNSIGERLKNCSTVATMGSQLAAALNNVQ